MLGFVIRSANESDAEGISEVLQELVRAGKRNKNSDAAFAKAHYIGHPDQVRCSLAVDNGGRVLGFQSLKRAVENNPYGAPVGWGVIGTHIRPSAARRGIGRALFEATLGIARELEMPAIDATIGLNNAEGLAYYEAMGFREYRRNADAISKSFALV